MRILIFFILFSVQLFSQDTIPTSKVQDYLNKVIVVTGKVVSYRIAPEGKIINFINLDKQYPDCPFTVVITNEYLKTLNLRLQDLKNKTIFVKGKITVYDKDPKQTPQIFNPIDINF
jgi:hypothetical protein